MAICLFECVDEPGRAPNARRDKQIAAHFPEDVAWQLRALAVERKTTVQNLMAEALNDLFAKYGKPEVAPLSGMAGYPDGG
jgi:hypothetical protein